MRRRVILRLHQDPNFLDLNAEKTQRVKEARREQLDVSVVELSHGVKAQFLREACDIVLAGNDIHGEPEKVLTLRVAPNGAISFGVAIPASESKGLIALIQETQSFDEISVDGEIGA